LLHDYWLLLLSLEGGVAGFCVVELSEVPLSVGFEELLFKDEPPAPCELLLLSLGWFTLDPVLPVMLRVSS
jgi:hypothetical protein